MKKATLTLFTFLIALSLYTQQWTGPNGGNITTSYNVGIGTTNPNEKLHINEGNINVHGFNTSRFLRFTESSLQGGFINYDGTSNVLNIGVNNISSNDPSNDHNAISVLRANGYVGIGTTSPNARLAVNGDIHAKEVKVDLVGWPDYVFKSDYELPSLKEVEDHIKEKGHLQDIPSALEVAENGIRLGEMDAKLLQKIEELMLYTINQQKEIQKLIKEMNSVKAQNQELQNQLNQIQSR